MSEQMYPLSEFTPEEAAKVAEFEAAETPPEDAEAALIEAAAAALAEDANAGSVFDPIDLDPEMYEANEEDREYFRGQARAALAVFRGQQDPAVQRVLELAESWRYKGEYGWGAWQEGHGPDQEGHILDQAAAAIRAAIIGDGR